MSPGRLPPLVLGYHTVADLPRERDPNNLVVSPRRFREQVETLRRRGYAFAFATEFADRLVESGPPHGMCALTFDDGSDDPALFELLEELGVRATLFVCPGLLGRPHPWLAADAGVSLLAADELRRVAALPWIEIGSHTNTHLSLAAATEAEAHEELLSSRLALEELLGRPVTSVAYPFGHYSPGCPAAAERAGYRCAVAGEGRGGWRPFELRREGIARWDGRASFALKSRGLGHALLRSRAGRLALRARRASSRHRQRVV